MIPIMSEYFLEQISTVLLDLLLTNFILLYIKNFTGFSIGVVWTYYHLFKKQIVLDFFSQILFSDNFLIILDYQFCDGLSYVQLLTWYSLIFSCQFERENRNKKQQENQQSKQQGGGGWLGGWLGWGRQTAKPNATPEEEEEEHTLSGGGELYQSTKNLYHIFLTGKEF